MQLIKYKHNEVCVERQDFVQNSFYKCDHLAEPETASRKGDAQKAPGRCGLARRIRDFRISGACYKWSKAKKKSNETLAEEKF